MTARIKVFIFGGLLIVGLSTLTSAALSGNLARGPRRPVVHQIPFRKVTMAGQIIELKRQIYHLQDFEMRRVTVQETTVKDINADGEQDVVAFLNLGGTADPAEILTFMSSGGQYFVQTFSAEHAQARRCLKDIDDDGLTDLIVWSWWPMGTGTPHTEALVWPELYRWADDGFRPASEELSVYYQTDYLNYLANRLQEVARLAALNQGAEREEKLAAMNLSVLRDCATALERTLTLLESAHKTQRGN